MTNSLWIALTVLIVLALLFVLVPVWRYKFRQSTQSIEILRHKNIEVFKQSQRDLKKELEDKLISKEEFAKLEAELKRNLLKDLDELEKSRNTAKVKAGNRLIPVTMALLIPVMSVGLYLQWGAGQDILLPQLLEEIRTADSQEEQDASINRMLQVLQSRFDRLPEDIQNGYMLGTMYTEMDRYEEAINTFDRMLGQMEPTPDKATVYGQKSQALFLQAGQQMTQDVRDTMNQALNLNPNEQAVMSVLAIDAVLNERYTDALTYWKRQLSQLNPNSQRYLALQQRIAQLQQLIPETELAPDSQVAGNAGSRVEVSVSLDASIAGNISDDMRVFVFARDPASAIPAPVAARTFSVSELPATIILDDSAAMMAGRTLSTADSVVIGARISQTGNAIAQSGDYQVISDPIELGEESASVSLVIRDRVP